MSTATSTLVLGVIVGIAMASTGYAAARLAANSVGTKQLKRNAVTSAKLKANAVTSVKLKSNSVTDAKIATNAVTSSEIKADAVGVSEIAAAAVTATEIALGAVGSDEIATGAVGTAEIEDGSIAAADIGSGAVAASNLQPGGEGQVLATAGGVAAWSDASYVPLGRTATHVPTQATNAASGTALLAAVTAAGAGAATEHKTLLLESGTYDLAATTLTLPAYLDIVGLDGTIITGTADPIVTSTGANVLRRLSIWSTDTDGTTVVSTTGQLLLYNATVKLDGTGTATSIGIYNDGGIADLYDSNVTLAVNGAADSRGVDSTGTTRVIRTSITADTATGSATAVNVQGLGASVTDSTLNAYNSGAGTATGISVDGASTDVLGSYVGAITTGGTAYSVNALAGRLVTIDHSRLRGQPYSAVGGSVFIGASRLYTVSAGVLGTLTCASSFKAGDYTDLSATCT